MGFASGSGGGLAETGSNLRTALQDDKAKLIGITTAAVAFVDDNATPDVIQVAINRAVEAGLSVPPYVRETNPKRYALQSLLKDLDSFVLAASKTFKKTATADGHPHLGIADFDAVRQPKIQEDIIYTNAALLLHDKSHEQCPELAWDLGKDA